jgi:hypothetical protein
MFREQFRFPFRAVRGTQSKSRAMARFLRIVSRCVATAVGRWTVILHTCSQCDDDDSKTALFTQVLVCLTERSKRQRNNASSMGNLLGKEKPLKEVLRENKRMITRAVRELDREKQGLEKEEKRLTMEIKKAARENQMASVKIMAKVRIIETNRLMIRCSIDSFVGAT